MKRKNNSTRQRLFAKQHYVKPTILERVIGRASIVWESISDLKLSNKPVSKWSIKQKEEYIKALNKYSCITSIDDPGTECGDLYDILERVNRYLFDGNDDEMITWLDPDYINISWLNVNQLALPDLNTVVPSISLNVPIANTIQPNCYLVQSRIDGEFLIGRITQRWPGVIGFVVSSSNPLVFRS